MNQTEKTPAKSSTPWVGGLVLLAVGILLLAQMLGIQISGSVWGALLLIPAVGVAFAGYKSYRTSGGSPEFLSAVATAFFFLALAMAIIVGVDLSLLWPVLLIGLAVSIIVRSVLGGKGS